MTPEEYLEERVNSGCDFDDVPEDRDYLAEAYAIMDGVHAPFPAPRLRVPDREHIVAIHNHHQALIRTYQKLVDQMREQLCGKGRVA